MKNLVTKKTAKASIRMHLTSVWLQWIARRTSIPKAYVGMEQLGRDQQKPFISAIAIKHLLEGRGFVVPEALKRCPLKPWSHLAGPAEKPEDHQPFVREHTSEMALPHRAQTPEQMHEASERQEEQMRQRHAAGEQARKDLEACLAEELPDQQSLREKLKLTVNLLGTGNDDVIKAAKRKLQAISEEAKRKLQTTSAVPAQSSGDAPFMQKRRKVCNFEGDPSDSEGSGPRGRYVGHTYSDQSCSSETSAELSGDESAESSQVLSPWNRCADKGKRHLEMEDVLKIRQDVKLCGRDLRKVRDQILKQEAHARLRSYSGTPKSREFQRFVDAVPGPKREKLLSSLGITSDGISAGKKDPCRMDKYKDRLRDFIDLSLSIHRLRKKRRADEHSTSGETSDADSCDVAGYAARKREITKKAGSSSGNVQEQVNGDIQ